ncbi:hypothetical protein J2Z66_008382 [Paenibacillus eucommiae]|uniref:Transposase IS110-like N-terminal domain-containing protein n=1 Tax=Paenibacillus eucommiae TaxID=1355755 RepID=A0ABS4JDF2_9BACL|nr:hypothetical protein [Paenibacillus eucommiae]
MSVYWKPIVNLFEAEDIEFLVVNAQHMKAVPGRKTDVKDAEWICQLLRHGLIKANLNCPSIQNKCKLENEFSGQTLLLNDDTTSAATIIRFIHILVLVNLPLMQFLWI